MLHFFRTHQKYFYAFVTTMIVISFSFFGVINSISGPTVSDPVAFEAVDGSSVRESDLTRMAAFISTDDYDKIAFQGTWGPNFLNDGVIPKDFFAKGLMIPVIKAYSDLLQPDFNARQEKEKRYQLYHHPQAKYIGVESVWNYLAPDMKKNFDALREDGDPLSEEKMRARAQLFLGQRKLPPLHLKQIMRYQQKQYNWVPEDPYLASADLSLFGYQTVTDWLGERFTALAAALIIDIAKIAEQQGVRVSDDEALASLMKQARVSYQQNQNSPYMNVRNADQYFQEQLRRMRMDINQAVATWRQVLLFRRYFDQFGETMVIDRLPYLSFSNFAQEYVEGDLYQLPESLRLSTFRDLQHYEHYIRTVAKPGAKSLSIPTRYFDPAQVAERNPLFVQRRYRVHVAMIDTEDLKQLIGTKEMWDWQLADLNWLLLEEEFPSLGTKEAKDRASRFAALDDLSPILRDKVDSFSRNRMIADNPAWVDRFLDEAEPNSQVVGLRAAGSETPFEGIRKASELMALFDHALDGDEEASQELSRYTEDGRHIYRFVVNESAPDIDILTFEELKKDGTLDASLRETLEAHYVKIRDNDEEKYRAANGEWKPFQDVRDFVAKHYFSDILLAVNAQVESEDPLTVDDAARYRFTSWVKDIKESVERDPDHTDLIKKRDLDLYDQDLSPRLGLGEQWKLSKIPYKLRYAGERDERIGREKAFALAEGEWSDVYTPVQGDVTFFHLRKKGRDDDASSIVQAMSIAQSYLARDAERALMEKTLKDIDAKKPIVLRRFSLPGGEDGIE